MGNNIVRVMADNEVVSGILNHIMSAEYNLSVLSMEDRELTWIQHAILFEHIGKLKGQLQSMKVEVGK